MSSRRAKKDQRKQLQKWKPTDGLRRSLEHGPLAGRKFVISPPGKEKMSDVLEDFIEPYMDSVEGEEAYRRLLTLATLAWNAALLPEDRQKAMIDDVLTKGLPPDSDALVAGLRFIVEAMVDRKKAHFSSNRRAIISFELTDRGRDYHLTVASTLGDSPAS
jgi:hypothetical protein